MKTNRYNELRPLLMNVICGFFLLFSSVNSYAAFPIQKQCYYGSVSIFTNTQDTTTKIIKIRDAKKNKFIKNSFIVAINTGVVALIPILTLLIHPTHFLGFTFSTLFCEAIGLYALLGMLTLVLVYIMLKKRIYYYEEFYWLILLAFWPLFLFVSICTWPFYLIYDLIRVEIYTKKSKKKS